MPIIQLPSNKFLFGQYLIREKKVKEETLKKALEVQAKEDREDLRQSHRLLGQILLKDFSIFKNRLELNEFIKDFSKYRDEVESILTQAAFSKDKKKHI